MPKASPKSLKMNQKQNTRVGGLFPIVSLTARRNIPLQFLSFRNSKKPFLSLNMKNLILIVLLLSTGCSSTWHLRKAQLHMDRAKQKGAQIESDTVYKKLRFIINGPSTSINLTPLIGKTNIPGRSFIKDTIIYKDRIRVEFKDREIKVVCPDEDKEIKTPVAVNTQIKSGFTLWNLISTGFILFVIGFLVSKIYDSRRSYKSN